MKYEMYIRAMLGKLSVAQFTHVVNDLAQAEDAEEVVAILQHYFGRSDFFWVHQQSSAHELVARQARQSLDESGQLIATTQQRYKNVYKAVVVYLKMKEDVWLEDWPLDLVKQGNPLLGTISTFVEFMAEVDPDSFEYVIDRIGDNETFETMNNTDFVPFEEMKTRIVPILREEEE